MTTTRLTALLAFTLLCLVVPVAAQAQNDANETAALPLTATYTSPDGSLSFQYPGGWVVEANGPAAILATHRAVMEPGLTLPAGEMRADIYAAAIASLPGLDESSTLRDVLDTATQVATLGDCEPFGEPVEITINDRPALRADQVCSAVDSVLIVVGIDEATVGVIGGSTLLGGMNKFAATLVAIGGTIEHGTPPTPTPAPLTNLMDDTDSFTTTDGAIELRYPTGWSANEQNGWIRINDPSLERLVMLVQVSHASMLPPDVEPDVESVLNWIISTVGSEVPYEEPETFQIGALRAARARAANDEFNGLALVVEIAPDQFAILNALTPPGGLVLVEGLVYSITATIRFDPERLAQPEMESEPESEPEAASTESVSEDAESITTDSADLTESYTTPDEQLSLHYPEGWFITLNEEQELLILARSENFQLGPPQPGEPFAVIQLLPVSLLYGDSPPANINASLVETLSIVRDEGNNLPYEDPVPLLLDGRPAASMSANVTDFDNSVYITAHGNTHFVTMTAFSAESELAEFEPVFLAVLSSITVDGVTETAQQPTEAPFVDAEPTEIPPAPEPTFTPIPRAPVEVDLNLNEIFTSPDGSLTVRYPEGWTASALGAALALSNVDELDIVSAGDALDVQQGEFRILLTIETLEERSLDDVFSANAEGIAVGEAESFTVDDHAGLQTAIDTRVMRGTLAVADIGNERAAVVTIFHSPDDRTAVQRFLPDFIGSIRLTE